jgi:predicted nucleic acid-binding protein
MILVDSCVIIDLIEDDPRWADWSQQQLDSAALRDSLAINAVIYAEISVGFDGIEPVDAMLKTTQITVEPIPREALFLAGKAFRRYKTLGGTRTGTLPDFFIGAHAAVRDIPLLTRDLGRYGAYFPTLRLISPAPAQR